MSSHHFPSGFVQRIEEQLGSEAEAFFSALNEPPPVSVRLHPVKGRTSLQLKENVLWNELGFYLDKRPHFQMDPLWHAGGYYVQEASSMVLDYVLRQIELPDRPIVWFDMCAAPGGKTGILASRMREGDVLVANEVVPSRRKILFENLIKLGHTDVFVSSVDSKTISKPVADVMLIDAPCSGEGMMRKDPEAINQWSERLISNCSLLQHKILHEATEGIVPGGWLIYSTCSYSPEENIKNVRLLVDSGTFESIEINFPAEWNIDQTGSDEIFGYQLWPHRVKGEGLFISLLRKKEAFYKETKTKKLPVAKSPDEWLKSVDHVIFQKDGESFVLHEKAKDLTSLVLDTFRNIQPIGSIGTTKGKDFIPSHFLAMSELSSVQIPVTSLNFDQALEYLEKKTIPLPIDFIGWGLVAYDHINLGWVKMTQQGLKNHYPMEWRLRQRIN